MESIGERALRGYDEGIDGPPRLEALHWGTRLRRALEQRLQELTRHALPEGDQRDEPGVQGATSSRNARGASPVARCATWSVSSIGGESCAKVARMVSARGEGDPP